MVSGGRLLSLPCTSIIYPNHAAEARFFPDPGSRRRYLLAHLADGPKDHNCSCAGWVKQQYFIRGAADPFIWSDYFPFSEKEVYGEGRRVNWCKYEC